MKTYLKAAFQRFISIRGRPHEIALGFSVGLFIGITPFLGLHTGMAVFLAVVLKWSKIAAATGVWICNPITAPFIYGAAYLIGSKLTGIRAEIDMFSELTFNTFINMLAQAPEILWVLTIGGIIIGIPISVTGYYLSYSAIRKYQKKARKKESVIEKRPPVNQ